jgi:hypothetical protein
LVLEHALPPFRLRWHFRWSIARPRRNRHLHRLSVPPKARGLQNEHPRCSLYRPRVRMATISCAPPLWQPPASTNVSCCTHPSRRLHGPPVPPFTRDTQNEHPTCSFCVPCACVNVLSRRVSMVGDPYTTLSRVGPVYTVYQRHAAHHWVRCIVIYNFTTNTVNTVVCTNKV